MGEEREEVPFAGEDDCALLDSDTAVLVVTLCLVRDAWGMDG
jgi:hypothetical protein